MASKKEVLMSQEQDSKLSWRDRLAQKIIQDAKRQQQLSPRKRLLLALLVAVTALVVLVTANFLATPAQATLSTATHNSLAANNSVASNSAAASNAVASNHSNFLRTNDHNSRFAPPKAQSYTIVSSNSLPVAIQTQLANSYAVLGSTSNLPLNLLRQLRDKGRYIDLTALANNSYPRTVAVTNFAPYLSWIAPTWNAKLSPLAWQAYNFGLKAWERKDWVNSLNWQADPYFLPYAQPYTGTFYLQQLSPRVTAYTYEARYPFTTWEANRPSFGGVSNFTNRVIGMGVEFNLGNGGRFAIEVASPHYPKYSPR